MRVLDDALVAQIAEEKCEWLLLEPHPQFAERWLVQGFDPQYFYELRDVIGPYKQVSPATLAQFAHECERLGYRFAFFDDPTELVGRYERLGEPPAFAINSTMPDTIAGMIPFQLQGFNFLRDLSGGIALWSTGPQPEDEPVLTPSGWSTIGALKPGNKVIGSSGYGVDVIDVERKGDLSLWRVDFSDGTHTFCSPDHLWTVDYWTNGPRVMGRRDSIPRRITATTRDLLASKLHWKSGSKSGSKGGARFALPLQTPVEYTSITPLPLGAYGLGLLLGDGSLSRSPQFTTADPELLDSLASETGAAIVYSDRYTYRVNGIMGRLRYLGVLGFRSWQKAIPEIYMRAPASDRLALLQGLLDTDGNASGSGASFTSTSGILAKQVVELCRSLGGYATEPVPRVTFYTHKGVRRAGRTSFRTQLSLDAVLFRLARKESARAPFRRRYKRITSIVPSARTRPMVCIRIAADDSLYVTRGFNLTHNTGKTAVASALLKYHTLQESFDIAWFVVKAHNKINTQRALARLVDLESVVIKGDKAARRKQYGALESGAIAITNYEKFRFDEDEMIALIEDRRVLIIWDEMPTKLSSRKANYRSVVKCLYRTTPPAVNWKKKRPRELRQFMLSATPVKRDPEGYFNCVRILDPRIYGTVKEFRNEYVASYSFFDPNAPEDWHKLDKMGLKAAHITHQVDREKDPEIAKLFPKRIEEPFYIDWDEKDRKIYDLAAKKAIDLLDDTNILSLIGVLQMLCNAPSSVNASAALREAYEAAYSLFAAQSDPWSREPAAQGSAAALAVITALGTLSDTTHTKIQTLKMLLTEKHASEKAIVFSMFNEGLLPIMERWLKDWGVTYVRYGGSMHQKQACEDAFREDPNIQVFLSSDQGADSINLPEASVVIDYDMPFGWDTKKQRNRHDRITSEHETIRRYHLLMEDSVEDRKMAIIERKRGYHDGIFSGALADQLVSAKLTHEDLSYILGL